MTRDERAVLQVLASKPGAFWSPFVVRDVLDAGGASIPETRLVRAIMDAYETKRIEHSGGCGDFSVRITAAGRAALEDSGA